jgi:4a-hydroxytetrahydrobiopterin dehydratase
MSDLAKKRCIPCTGGVPKLEADEIAKLHPQVPDWEVVLTHHLRRVFSFDDYAGALAFVNRIGEVAEAENHHPNISFTWGRVEVEIWTHKIDGLAESDFVLAAKIDQLPRD